MRNLILTLCSFVVLTTAVQAKMSFDDTKSFQTARVLKIGRSTLTANDSLKNMSSASSQTPTYITPCDENCADCNVSASECRQCKDYYYLSETGCSSICAGVTCVSGASAKEYATECCCE